MSPSHLPVSAFGISMDSCLLTSVSPTGLQFPEAETISYSAMWPLLRAVPSTVHSFNKDFWNNYMPCALLGTTESSS